MGSVPRIARRAGACAKTPFLQAGLWKAYRSRHVVAGLAALTLLFGILPAFASAGPLRQAATQLKVGPVAVIALDNNGGGWGWTGPANPSDNGHLIRLQNNAWADVPRTDAAGGNMVRTAAAVDNIVLSGDGTSGWATGTGGGARLWHYVDGSWQSATHPFPRDVVWSDLTMSADGADGWLVAGDRSLRYQVARLRGGRWVLDYQPVNAEMRFIAISPDGLSGWGVGQWRRDPSKYVAVRLDKGRWVEDSNAVFEVPYNSGPVTVDNAGNGWTTSPRIDSMLIRLTPGGATVAGAAGDTGIVYSTVSVNGAGRGWATGVLEVRPSQDPGSSPANQPVLLRLDGDNVERVPFGAVPSTHVDANPNEILPVAFSPDGAHSWAAGMSGDVKFLGLYELTEPWPHDTPGAASPLPGAGICFKEVPYCLRGMFASYWRSHGGLDSLGYPVTPEVQENIGGKQYTVQYTQRARLEYHPENSAPNNVLLGLLGNSLAEPRVEEPPFQPAAQSAQAGYAYFAPTRHNVGPPFLAYWNANGGLPVLGLPRSEAFTEVSRTDGKTYMVQYFERNRVEYHPENRGTRYEFLLGLLGVEQFQATYGYAP